MRKTFVAPLAARVTVYGGALLCVGFSAGCYAKHDVADAAGSAGHAPAMPGAGGAPFSEPEPGENAGAPAMLPGGAAGAPALVEGCVRSRFVLVDSVENARDVGGLPVEAGGAVACGSIEALRARGVAEP